jgi:hypothetical protein
MRACLGVSESVCVYVCETDREREEGGWACLGGDAGKLLIGVADRGCHSAINQTNHLQRAAHSASMSQWVSRSGIACKGDLCSEHTAMIMRLPPPSLCLSLRRPAYAIDAAGNDVITMVEQQCVLAREEAKA